MIAFFERLKAIGWAYGEKLTSTQQSAIDSRQQKLMSDQVDDWLQNWTTVALAHDVHHPTRLASGLTIAGVNAASNTVIFMADVQRVSTNRVVAPASGNWQYQDCCGYGTNAMFAGSNTTDYTKAVWSVDKANMLNMTERTITGAVVGDFAGAGCYCVVDPTDGYFYIFSGVAARKVWSSPTAATWTARAAATGVNTLSSAGGGTGRPVVANNGHLITFGDNGAAIGQFSYSSDYGATWTTTTIASSEPIVGMNWSPTRGLWVVVGKFGRVWTSATPGGAFTLQNTAFSTVAPANRITTVVVADGVIAAVYDNLDGGANRPGCLLLYSIDLGATWKAVAIDEAENAGLWFLGFDNQALWLRRGTTNYRTRAIGNPMTVANGTIGT